MICALAPCDFLYFFPVCPQKKGSTPSSATSKASASKKKLDSDSEDSGE